MLGDMRNTSFINADRYRSDFIRKIPFMIKPTIINRFMFMNKNLLLIIVGLFNLALALSLPLLFAISRLFVHINNMYGRICYLSSYPRFSCFHWRKNYINIASSLICLNRRSRLKKIYSLVNSQTRSYSTNEFINKLDESVKTKYNNLPNTKPPRFFGCF